MAKPMFNVVSQAGLPAAHRREPGKFAQALAQMIELPKGQAIEVLVKNDQDGHHFKRCLVKIANKERSCGTVQWTRSADGKTFWFWLEGES